MNYEAAWMRDDLPVTVSGIERIDKVCICTDKALTNCDNRIVKTARDELEDGLKNAFKDKKISVGFEALKAEDINDENEVCGAFEIAAEGSTVDIKAQTPEGVLYGVFRFLQNLRIKNDYSELSGKEAPKSQLRMLNHWDNLDGSIERGYSGESFFFKNNKVIVDDRTRAYARLVASVGVNGLVINNVNVKQKATELISYTYRKEVKALGEIFADYGIGLYLSLNFASPIELGKMDTCDPLDKGVQAWWKAQLDDLFTDVPTLKGFLIKADSEGRPGPFTYGRDHAEGANMLADIVAPYGGIIIWRCFVYNCKQDWRDTKTDRARAQYDNFKPLDGKFRDNVILQIKNGPMDFQIREPISPLLGGMHSTNQMLEVQIAQEYTGQQKHVCYLIPEFKEVLEFRTYVRDKNGVQCDKDTVCDIVTGRTFNNTLSGMCAVSNTGDDPNWTGHDLAAANLYGFGRLMFDPELTSEEIAKEWICLTFGNDSEILQRISFILLASWPAYEKYSSPLGVGWMVNPSHHYGPNVDGYEFSEWGTYHRSDSLGMGVDRGEKGTDYAHQYNEPNASMYNDVTTCPDELILFFHHVPYTHRLHSGKTVIQHIYDTHYEGVEDVVKMREAWIAIKDKIDETVYYRTLKRLEMQLVSACEWRDHVNGYYREKSGIPDEQGRI